MFEKKAKKLRNQSIGNKVEEVKFSWDEENMPHPRTNKNSHFSCCHPNILFRILGVRSTLHTTSHHKTAQNGKKLMSSNLIYQAW